MRFTLVAIGLGFLLALVFGGRPRFLAGKTLRWWFLLPVGFLLQLAAIQSRGDFWPLSLVLVSYACLFLFAVLNLSVTGMWLIAVGLFLNALVVGVNHGMPVGHKALDHVGHSAAVYPAEHHTQRSSDRLLIIGDVIPVAPLDEVVTFGDIILAVGIVDVLFHLLRPPKRRREEEDEDRLLPLLDDVVHA